jgi:hypothetical protein
MTPQQDATLALWLSLRRHTVRAAAICARKTAPGKDLWLLTAAREQRLLRSRRITLDQQLDSCNQVDEFTCNAQKCKAVHSQLQGRGRLHQPGLLHCQHSHACSIQHGLVAFNSTA